MFDYNLYLYLLFDTFIFTVIYRRIKGKLFSTGNKSFRVAISFFFAFILLGSVILWKIKGLIITHAGKVCTGQFLKENEKKPKYYYNI